ncbi:MAG: hypothetical protein JZU64_07845 [Rhodoferax sp.]|nr:hypothetical protein [Rhodoferax sp.]
MIAALIGHQAAVQGAGQAGKCMLPQRSMALPGGWMPPLGTDAGILCAWPPGFLSYLTKTTRVPNEINSLTGIKRDFVMARLGIFNQFERIKAVLQ